ncbi:aldehyde dehydrogenase domain-containing protein [Plectosphaerella plurivora]|uniref:Aldehyde dehydrogenase domain-containing protein n=1 Tax=Plectosphaerella plurivora TaxID=936078 RepID=A0A9P8V3F4_9PEZI|nr:aldehyde dehydrogenase domain-containing protein [Plectosphaerella plurivora]
MSGTERGALMLKLADLAEASTEMFASIDTWNNGKRISSARGDVSELTCLLRYYAGYADKIHGKIITPNDDKLAYTLREPLGVCGQIIPWNYPLGMLSWKLAPAIAAGNTVLLKPAEQTPLSALYFANLVKEAGFPPGIINIVNGLGREAGAAIASHPLVNKIAFTGSTVTGREIMRLASGTLKNITLETGGKSPAIVFRDADIGNAVAWCHYGIMANQGQICTSTSRILVQDDVYNAFVKAFVERFKTVSKVGDPYTDGTFQGPQVSRAQYDRVLSYIEKGKSEGASVTLGGKPFKGPQGKGFYIEPTVFTGVTDKMTIWNEEIFGPCVVISPFSSDEEAIKRANNSMYGLGAALFTENITKAHRLTKKIQAGMVWINSSNDSDFRIPFGGLKQSGIGSELGEEGLSAYTVVKAVHVNLGEQAVKSAGSLVSVYR